MILFIFEHVPLFKHGLLEQGLESVWHDTPVLNWLHSQIYCCNEFCTQIPWLEQFAKQADKSLKHSDRTIFNWFPVLFVLNNDDALTVIRRVDDDLMNGDEVSINWLLVDNADVSMKDEESVEDNDEEESVEDNDDLVDVNIVLSVDEAWKLLNKEKALVGSVGNEVRYDEDDDVIKLDEWL